MVLDPKKHADWEIAQDAETRMKTVQQLGRDMGLLDKELLPYGHVMGKVDYRAVLERLGDKPNGKYVDVTAITPTPLGEGKSTTTIGLVQGLGRRNKRASAAIRQPSGGPTMGVKGSAAGGGLSQCIPLTQYSLGFTGDINAVMNAHNLAMVALTSRMQHERNYNDEKLLKLSGTPRLNIDPTNVNMGWVMDFCCQSLRNIIIGMDGTNGRSDGFMMRSRFDIAVSSEVMAILAIAKDLKDLRQRMGKIIVAYDRDGKPVTTADLEVDGAMTAWMVEAINPNLIQTIEGQPVFVHAGPFANIAIGQSSVIADRIGLKLNEYHVTESGFGADIGYEKFWNLKCHYSGLTPDAAVVVATVRALKSHGGVPKAELNTENLDALEKGLPNLLHHVNTIRGTYHLPCVVAINAFPTDTEAELRLVEDKCRELGVRAVLSEVWAKGGEGGKALAEEVVRLCEQPCSEEFTFSYPTDTTLVNKLNAIVQRVYGGAKAVLTPAAQKQAERLTELGFGDLPVCMAKTQYSLSDDPTLLGAPKDFSVTVRSLKVSAGAGFIVALTGEIMTMPGLPKVPAAEKIDVDENGRITGLF